MHYFFYQQLTVGNWRESSIPNLTLPKILVALYGGNGRMINANK